MTGVTNTFEAMSSTREGLALGEGKGAVGGGEDKRSRLSRLEWLSEGKDRLKKSSMSGAPPRLLSMSKSCGSEMMENRTDDLRDEPAMDDAHEGAIYERDMSGTDRRCASRSALRASADGRDLGVFDRRKSGAYDSAGGPLYLGMGNGRGAKSDGDGTRLCSLEVDVLDNRRDWIISNSDARPVEDVRRILLLELELEAIEVGRLDSENRTRLDRREMGLGGWLTR